jgi:arabinose-5-phosphate isomerase
VSNQVSEAVRSSRLSQAQEILRAESAALAAVAERLNGAFERVIDRIANCPGRLAVSGVGKSADVAQKIVGTLNSTGTRAYLLDATRAVHGDLGMVHPQDAALVLSHSGESEEVIRLIGPLRELTWALLAITGNAGGTLARSADAAIVYGPIEEACPLLLAPSTSTTVMMALGDAIAFVLSQMRGFTALDFASVHPAGSLGRKLATVSACMRKGADLRIARAAETIRAVFARSRQHGRRTGAIMLLDDDGRLAGLFTDSDLARLFERRADDALDRPIGEVMTRSPITIRPEARMEEAVALFAGRKISEVPVIDEERHPIGLLDITDVIGLLPAEARHDEDNPPVDGIAA